MNWCKVLIWHICWEFLMLLSKGWCLKCLVEDFLLKFIFFQMQIYIYFFIMFHFLFLSESGGCCRSKKLSYQELGIAKLSGFCEWLSIHPLISESDGVAKLDVNHSSQKMIIFAHHLKVLDGVQVRCFYQFSFLFARLKTSS